MDKKKWRCLSSRDIIKDLKKGFWPFAKAGLAVFGCGAFVWGTLCLAKEGSPIFYCAVAFASPGSVMEMWQEAVAPLFRFSITSLKMAVTSCRLLITA